MKKTILLSILATSAFSFAQGQVVVYAQGFSNNSGVSKNIADYEWGLNTAKADGTGFLDRSATTRVSGTNDGLSAITNVNAIAPYGNNVAIGIADFATGQGANNAATSVAWTDDADIQVNVSILSSITFDAAKNNSDAGTLRIAVQISNQWYASTATITPNVATGGGFDTGAGSYIFNWTNAAADWQTFSFTEGTSLNPALTVAGGSLSGTVQSLGLFYSNGDGNDVAFFDNFSVTTAIPEPSTYALIGGFLALGLVMVRRRIRS